MGILPIDRYINIPAKIWPIRYRYRYKNTSVLNGVSDVINLNRWHSGVRVTVTLSTALDASPTAAASHTNAKLSTGLS